MSKDREQLPSTWVITGRRRRPFEIEQITVVDQAGTRIGGEAHEQDTLSGAIGDKLLRLDPDDPDTFIRFVTTLGLGEFLEWTQEEIELTEIWSRVHMDHQLDQRTFEKDYLLDPWAHPETARALRRQQNMLRLAYETAMRGGREGLQDIIALGWEQNAFQIELDYSSEFGVIYERPTHIFSRAWFDLVDRTSEGVLPRWCDCCGRLMLPNKRRDARHCDATCAKRDHDRRRSSDPWRKEFKVMNQRKNRGKISQEEYDNWLEKNPRPEKGDSN